MVSCKNWLPNFNGLVDDRTVFSCVSLGLSVELSDGGRLSAIALAALALCHTRIASEEAGCKSLKA